MPDHYCWICGTEHPPKPPGEPCVLKGKKFDVPFFRIPWDAEEASAFEKLAHAIEAGEILTTSMGCKVDGPKDCPVCKKDEEEL